MIRVKRAACVLFTSLLLAAGAGCQSTKDRRAGGRDLHSSARIAGDTARMLVSGPALLMHVDVEGRDDLALYAVARKQGTEADCAAGQSGGRRRLRPGVPNLINLAVPADQTICIAPMPNTRSAAVMWHARRIDGGSVGHDDTLVFEAPGR